MEQTKSGLNGQRRVSKPRLEKLKSDKSAQMQAEMLLQAEEESLLHSEIMANMSEGVILTNATNAVIVYTNPKFDKMFGYSPGELIGKNISIVNAPSDKTAEEMAGEIQKSLKRHGTWREEIKNIKKDGTPFWCYANVSTFKHNHYGELWVAVHTDITERKQAEMLLQASEEQCRAIFEQAVDAIMLIDAETGAFVLFNDSAYKNLGYTKEEFQNLKIQDFEVIESAEEVTRHIEKIVKEGSDIFETRHRTKQGEICNVQVSAKAITIGGKKFIQAIWQDITERKQMEQSLRESEKLAAKGQIAAQIAHELNNPLAGIKNSLLLLKDAISKNHRHYRYLGLINNEIDRLSHIVHQMFDFYRPAEPQAKEFSVYKTISEVAELLEVNCREYEVAVNISSGKKKSVVCLQENLLRQVLYNIMKNAVEASPPGAVVQVRPKITGKTLTIEVADQGSGIAEDVQPHIFEPAFTTKKDLKTGGLGLGLSISRSIIEDMSGKIEFESNKGKGSVCRIIIPLLGAVKEGKNG